MTWNEVTGIECGLSALGAGQSVIGHGLTDDRRQSLARRPFQYFDFSPVGLLQTQAQICHVRLRESCIYHRLQRAAGGVNSNFSGPFESHASTTGLSAAPSDHNQSAAVNHPPGFRIRSTSE